MWLSVQFQVTGQYDVKWDDHSWSLSLEVLKGSDFCSVFLGQEEIEIDRALK
jgi:hypothetical protein